jgi:hypothetical protein
VSVEITLDQSVFVNLPADKTFGYISNLANMVDWSNVLIAVKQLSPAPVCVGTTMRSTFRFLGKWLDIIFEVVGYEPDSYVAFKSIAGGGPCFLCFHLDEREGGTTIREEARMNLIEGILYQEESVIVSAVRRQFEYDLQTLKEMLESRSPV